MKSVVLVFCISLSLFTAGCRQSQPKDETQTTTTTERPNIVFILADDLGISDLPAYGNEFNEAPNISKLAAEGMVFSNAYAAPVCSPSRASIQSGQVPARVGIFDFIPGHWRPFEEVTVPTHEHQHLPDHITTLGEVMKSAGYATGYFGKWHLGYNPEHMPQARGYDEAYVYAGAGGFYHPEFMPAYPNKEKKRLNDVLTDMSVEFINKNKENPFFLFVSHYDVHVQLDADKELVDKFKQKNKQQGYPSNAVYAGMIRHLDKSVGDLNQTLSDLGLAENTIVVFASDNGGVDNRFDRIPLLGGNSTEAYPADHPLRYIATSNSPYRAGKGTLYEGGVRVPLIVKWPGKVENGVVSDAVVTAEDFYPTFAQIVKGKLPDEQVIDGISMVPALVQNEFDAEREVFNHYPVYHHDQPKSAVRKGDWKIVENLVSSEVELFNLKFDIKESVDLKYSYPEKLKEMRGILKKWQEETNARMPVPNPDFDQEKRYEWGKHPAR